MSDITTLLPTKAFARVIARFEYGNQLRGRGDDWRGKTEDKEFLLDRLSHAIRHLHALHEDVVAGRELQEDHVGAVLWFGFFAAESSMTQVEPCPFGNENPAVIVTDQDDDDIPF